MGLRTILDAGAQFTLLMGILATGLTLVSVNNRLLDRIDRLGKQAPDSDRRTSRGLLAIMGLQLCIAIVLVIRIVLSAWELAYPFLDLMIAWAFWLPSLVGLVSLSQPTGALLTG